MKVVQINTGIADSIREVQVKIRMKISYVQ